MAIILAIIGFFFITSPVEASAPPVELSTTHAQTVTTHTVPMAPKAVSVLLGRLGLPEEGLQPIGYSEDAPEELDIAITLEDIWYALRVALTSYLILERQQAFTGLVLVALLSIVVALVWKMANKPPEI